MFSDIRLTGGLRESVKAVTGALLVGIWWQFVQFTNPVDPIPCETGVCPVLRPNWLVFGVAIAATLVGLDWVRSTRTTARVPVAILAAVTVVLVGLDIARNFFGHYVSAHSLAVEFIVLAIAGLAIAAIGVRTLMVAAGRLVS